MFFEYVRPQALYPIIQGLPFASWAIAACGLACLLESKQIRRMMLLDGLLALFTVIIIASSLTAYYPDVAFEKFMAVYFNWVIIYFLITHTVDSEKKFVVFMLLYFVWCLKMSQFGTRMMIERGFSFASWGLTCAPQFFHNSGECGIQLSMFIPASLYFLIGVLGYVTRGGKWLLILMPTTAAISIIGSSSRGAQLSLAALLLWVVLRSRRPFRALFIGAFAAIALYSILPEEQKDRFRTMGEDDTSIARRQYWYDGIQIMQDHPVLGVGFQNWIPYYRQDYQRPPTVTDLTDRLPRGRLPSGQLPHNIFIEAGAELGYLGLASFILMIVATFVVNRRTRKLAGKIPRGSLLWHMAHGLDGALIGFLVGGYFVTVLYYPFFWINLAMTAALYNVTRKAAEEHRRTAAAGMQASLMRPRAGNAA